MTNIRLDGYVYTRESFQETFKLLKPGINERVVFRGTIGLAL
jgi:hypothetical protein